MSEVKYTVIDQITENIPEVERYSAKDISLINNFIINKKFNFNTNYIESHFYTPNNRRLLSLYDYTLPNKEILAQQQSDEDDEESIENLIDQITLDPSSLADSYGYTNTEVKILFHFLDDVFTFDNTKASFFIKSISEDRTELALYSDSISFSRLRSNVEKLQEKLNQESYFDELWLNFGNNDLFIVTNIDTFKVDNFNTVTVKLYEPLPDQYSVDSTLQVVEKISDSIAVKVIPEFIEDEKIAPTIQGPNFSVEVNEMRGEPTDFQNYNTLFNYDNVNSNRELYSHIKENGLDLGIDYSNYSNFINFSSAEERLKNFKYKVELIETYQSDLDTEQALNNSTTATSISGSIEANKALIKGIIENFDHYERHLYYESGSIPWPKSNTKKPFINKPSSHSDVATWYSSSLISASNYDNSNYDAIINFLPDYIGEDTRNAPAILFAQMLGQHYDNLWIYSKAISDKYDTDHRLNRGISKDLVKEAVRSMGLKVYNSIEGGNNLFKYLINDSYDSGSAAEVINNFVVADSNNQPGSRRDYEGELYKRLYHNIPFLLKNKGTARGLRALINSFGIPAEILTIKEYGANSGTNSKSGPDSIISSSKHRITFETSSQATSDNNTLSLFTSTLDFNSIRTSFYSGSANSVVEVGFSPSDEINKALLTKLQQDNIHTQNKIDNFLGDPTNLNKTIYGNSLPYNAGTGADPIVLDTLQKVYERVADVLNVETPPNLKDFVRIFKFHDNVLYKMIHDFVPERAKLSTGIIIKPLAYNRSKIKSPSLTGTDDTYSGSIDTAFITGSHAGSFNLKDNSNFIDIEHRELPAPWYGQLGGATDIIFQFNNQGINSYTSRFEVGEIGIGGNEYFHPDGTHYILADRSNLTTPQEDSLLTPFEGGNNHYHFHIMFTSESVQQRFSSLSNSSDIHQHFVPIRHLGGRVETISQPTGANTGSSYAVTNDVDTSSTGTGTGLTINITAINGNDGVTAVSLVRSGQGYAVGDEITLIGEGDENCKFTVTGITDYYEVQGNVLLETVPLTGSIKRDNDVIISTVHQSGSGLATPVHNYYTSLSGNRVYTTGSYTSKYYNKVTGLSLTNAGGGGTIGSYNAVNISNGGFTYGGTGLVVKVTRVDSDGKVVEYEIENPGQDYIVGGVKTAAIVTAGTGYTATSDAIETAPTTAQVLGINFRVNNITVNSGAVTGFSISNPGFLYNSNDVVKISGSNQDATLRITDVANTLIKLDGFSTGGNADATLLVSSIEGIPKPSFNEGHFNAPTYYRKDFKTLSGSVIKQVQDSSPLFDGELSGSILTVTDGEVNKDNAFKRDIPNEIRYDITTVAQDGADVLTAFTIFNSGNSTSANNLACQLGGTPVTRYHNAPTSAPDTTDTGSFYDPNGDGSLRYVVTTQINGTGVVNGGNQWFKAGFSNTTTQTTDIYAIQINSSGQIIDMDLCTQFDQDPPDSFRYSWTVSSINASNVTAASFELHGLNEDVTVEYTASSDGGGSPIQATQALTFPPDGVSGAQNQLTQSISFDATNLTDGEVTLHVSASDASNNTTKGALMGLGSAYSYFGKVITKNVVAPTGYSGFIAHRNDALSSFATASIITSNTSLPTTLHFKVDVPSGFTGSVKATASGNGTTVTKTIDHPFVGPQTNGTDVAHVAMSTVDGVGSLYNRSTTPFQTTIYGSVQLIDSAGNAGTTVNVNNTSGYVVHRDYFYRFVNSSGTQYISNVSANSGGDIEAKYQVRFYSSISTLEDAYGESPSVSWASAEQFSNYDNTTRMYDLDISLSPNNTNNPRNSNLTGSLLVDSQTVELPSLAFQQNGLCVDPETQILTPQGFIYAGELKVGDIIKTKKEYLVNEWIQDIVTGIFLFYVNSKIKLTFDDGNILIGSSGHRVYVDTQSNYIGLDKLKEGDKCSGKIIQKIETVEGGDVVRITTEKSHTYISNGVLSHNDKQIQP